MRIMVTGGAGYIGSHTLVELAALGHKLCVIDNFHNSSVKVLQRVAQITGIDIPFHLVDIRDLDAVAAIFDEFRPEAVIHFAGLKAVGEAEEFPDIYRAVNVGGTGNILRAMNLCGCKLIVFSSSATIYGEPQYLPFDEAHPCNPVNVYGQTKLAAEELIAAWQQEETGRSAVILRYFNPVGAHESGHIGESPKGVPNNLFPYLAQVAVGRRKELQVFGDDYDTPDGTGMRDYIHVVDLAKAHVQAIENNKEKESVEFYNIGTGTAYSVLDLVAAFAAASNRKIAYRIVPRRAGDLPAYYADASKAAQGLGWRAKHDLMDMCCSGWRWQSENPDGYEI